MDPRNDATRRPPTDQPEPPFQALYPNLDRVSRSSFRKGTYSRRRIVHASIGLAVLALAIAGAVVLTTAM